MATVNLLVKSEIPGKLATIYMRFRHGKKTDIIVPTYLTVDPRDWSNKTQLYRQRIITPDYTKEDKEKREGEIKALKDYAGKQHSDLRGELPTREWLQNTIRKFESLRKPASPAPNRETLLQYIRRFVEEAESGKRLATVGNTRKEYSYGSLRVLRGFMLSFELFHTDPRTNELFGKKFTKVDLKAEKPEAIEFYKECRARAEDELSRGIIKVRDYEDITIIDFYNEFVKFFYDRNCGANYIGKHIKSLKTIMRQAREEGLHNNNEIERKAFKTLSEEVDNVYLTEVELQKLYDLDLSNNQVWSIARDVFLCGCYTAQRYSDYSRINKSNIKDLQGVRVIELIQKKTGEKCIIPIKPELDSILRRYDYTLPKTYEQKINANIKKIAATAEITEPTYIEKNKGGKTVKQSVRKCDLIKTHTARRSGCTLMYLAGIPVIDIMKISGHKTPKEFLKYIKTGKEETAINLASHPYFIGNPLRVAK